MYPQASPAERVQAFQHITPSDLAKLQQLCHKKIHNPSIADDAFAHAVGVCYEHFDGRVPLQSYFLTVAKNWAMSAGNTKDGRFATHFSDLEATYLDDDLSVVERVQDTTDYFAEANTPEWVEDVKSVLRDEASDPELGRGQRLNADRAHRILKLICADHPRILELLELPQTNPNVRLALEELYAGNLDLTATQVEVAMTYLRKKVARLLPLETRRLVKA